MNKYIDAGRLKAEVEKRLKNVRDYMNGAGMRYKGPKFYKAQGKESAYDALLNTIDSLQQEQQEVDLEKEYKEWWENKVSGNVNIQHTMEWYMHETAQHFYELGKNSK